MDSRYAVRGITDDAQNEFPLHANGKLYVQSDSCYANFNSRGKQTSTDRVESIRGDERDRSDAEERVCGRLISGRLSSPLKRTGPNFSGRRRIVTFPPRPLIHRRTRTSSRLDVISLIDIGGISRGGARGGPLKWK